MKNMLIAGNWKMNTVISESVKLVEDILVKMKDARNFRVKILICPPFTSLFPIHDMLDGSSVLLGAQNCHYESKGAFTGEVSIPMLKNTGCSYVIIGHSERRTYFNETDEIINKKLKALMENSITPIFCIGETLKERENSETFSVLKRQLDIGLIGIDSTDFVVAYEPVWAIGTGISATTGQVLEAHKWIRNYLVERYGQHGDSVLILYGGSLNDKNADSILSLTDVNGGLIGGASLNAGSFIRIIEIAESFA